MKPISIREFYLKQNLYHEVEVTVSGWIRTSRFSNNFGFLEINDGTHFNNLQIVVDIELDNFEDLSKLSIASSLTITGIFLVTPNAKQPFELTAKEIIVEGVSRQDYPLQKKRHSMEYLRTIAHLRPRSNTFSAVFRVRSLASFAVHKFFQDRGFVYVNTPIITGSDCEGAGEMFKVTTLDLKSPVLTGDDEIDYSHDFFGKETNLTVSGQLEAEAFAMAFRDVYTFGPTFRAENSNTKRHAAEFWMIEPEIAFADIVDNMDLAEEMIKYIISYVMENCKSELEFFNLRIDKGLLDRLNQVVNSDFERITYTQAVEIISSAPVKFEFPLTWGQDLQTEHERYLAEIVFKKPVFVIDYPKEIKSFYMRVNDDGKTVAAMDLLVPGVGELIGGSQREERNEVLLDRLHELDLNEDDYNWYMELRTYGATKHAGFGVGFERLVMYLTGMENIRDVIPFPRTVNNAEF